MRTGRSPFRVVVLVAVTLVGLAACGSPSPTGQASPGSPATPTAAGSPSPSPLACTPSGPASASFPGAPSIPSSPPPILAAAASGDVLTLTFSQGTPEFAVTPQSSARFFVGDGRGTNVDMAGTAGAVIVLRGFRGDMTSYAGAADQVSSGPQLLEVRHVSEFEGVISWAVGLAHPGCANVTAQGSTLTFIFIASRA